MKWHLQSSLRRLWVLLRMAAGRGKTQYTTAPTSSKTSLKVPLVHLHAACRFCFPIPIETIYCLVPWGRSSVGRATRSQCVGRGFDSLRLHPSSLRRLAGARKDALRSSRCLRAEQGGIAVFTSKRSLGKDAYVRLPSSLCFTSRPKIRRSHSGLEETSC